MGSLKVENIAYAGGSASPPKLYKPSKTNNPKVMPIICSKMIIGVICPVSSLLLASPIASVLVGMERRSIFRRYRYRYRYRRSASENQDQVYVH